MLQTQMEVKKVYSFLNPSINSWDLTDNEEVAKKDPLHSVASLEDLHDMVSGCGYIFEGFVQTIDGIVKWYEETTLDEHGFEDYSCGYKLVN
ncbi:MAG TPA: hypothetical protein VEY70_17515 [Metabacillus sp.]|nr:hypothetical protein [Metabacillus sp.]